MNSNVQKKTYSNQIDSNFYLSFYCKKRTSQLGFGLGVLSRLILQLLLFHRFNCQDRLRKQNQTYLTFISFICYYLFVVIYHLLGVNECVVNDPPFEYCEHSFVLFQMSERKKLTEHINCNSLRLIKIIVDYFLHFCWAFLLGTSTFPTYTVFQNRGYVDNQYSILICYLFVYSLEARIFRSHFITVDIIFSNIYFPLIDLKTQ